MKREQLSTIICNIDDRHIAQAYQFDPDLCARSSERIVHMSKKRIITFAFAAALMLALGAVAYAATNWFVEWRSLKNDPALQQQADIGADDLHQFAGGQFIADDDVLYEDGDQGQSDTTMYFFNDHTYSVDYYGSGEIHSLDARESFALEDHDGIADDMLHAALKRPAGAMATTVSLLRDAGYEVLCHEKEFLELHTALFKAAKKMDIDLDQSMHDGKEEGLPYNLEFVIRYGDAMTRCPKCGSKKIAPILYGMPVFDEEMQRKVNNQELYLGGCCVSDSDPQFHCFGCGKDFGKPISAE